MTLFKQAEERARELMASVPKAHIYVGICNTELAFDEFTFTDQIGVIRKVTNPPGVVAVCCAANLKETDYMGVGRYSGAIRGEFAFGPDGRSCRVFSTLRGIRLRS